MSTALLIAMAESVIDCALTTAWLTDVLATPLATSCTTPLATAFEAAALASSIVLSPLLAAPFGSLLGFDAGVGAAGVAGAAGLGGAAADLGGAVAASFEGAMQGDCDPEAATADAPALEDVGWGAPPVPPKPAGLAGGALS